MTDTSDDFSPREFLRERQAVLVHFSTLMASRLDLTFPNDLRQAMSLKGVPLSFSTIVAGDTNPQANGRGGAEGSVGLLVDIGDGTQIRSVSPSDSGSGLAGSFGVAPTHQNCADSIDNRTTSNEWHVGDYIPIGIFILPPIWVRQVIDLHGYATSTEVQLELGQAIAPFPEQRLFSANERTFLEFDRSVNGFKAVPYDEIIPPR